MYRLTGESEVIVGMPVAGRNHEDTKDLIGFFLNTLMLRDHIDAKASFSDFLDQVRTTLSEALDHQAYPFEKLLDALDIPRDYNHFPISPVFLNMLDFDLEKEKSNFKGPSSQHGQTSLTSKFDLECYFKTFKNGLYISYTYKKALFRKQSIEYWARELVSILSQVVENPNVQIDAIKVFDKNIFKIKQKKPTCAYSHFGQEQIQQCVVSRFETQVEKYPDREAICQNGTRLNYRELNAMANGIADSIATSIGTTGQHVALLFEHGYSAIAAMLAVLKSGNVYVPLDPTYPIERLKYMMSDSKSALILMNSETATLANKIIEDTNVALKMDIGNMTQKEKNPKLKIPPQNKAYILYTSGSTGKPKGVIQSHENILHFISVYTNNLHIASQDRLSLLPTYGFDSSVMDIYGALLNGASLHPYDIKNEGLKKLADWISCNHITILHTVPTIYRHFIEELGQQVLKGVRLVVLGGEAVYKNDFVNFKKHFEKGSIFINGYGPTESTITLQKHLDHTTQVPTANVPLGVPVQNTKIYLLDELNNNVGIYGVGEIVYKSEHLALGYLNNEELTSKVFVTDPITGKGRVYRSGDLGKRLPSGEIEFMGRIDAQIKLNGLRIELQEIEQNLLKIKKIKEAVVLKKPFKEQEVLVAYIRIQQTIEESKIKELLAKQLPSHMIPSIYVTTKTFPLTPTGKINRRALQKLPLDIKPKELIEPKGETEHKIVRIAAEVLGMETNQISMNDDFFEIGGHSIKAIQFLSLIRKELNVEFTIDMLFSNPKFQNISKEIKKVYWANDNNENNTDGKSFYI